MGLLAVNRYINICHNKYYAKWFTIRSTLFACVFTWCGALVFVLPNLLGWGNYTFDVETASCIWNRLDNYSYTLFLASIAVFLPSVCISFCYMRIFMFAASNVKNISAPNAGRKNMNKSLKIAQSLFASFISYSLMWLPYGIVMAADFADKYPMIVHTFTTAIAHFNSTLNPILYTIFNPAFRKSFIKMLNKLFYSNQRRKSDQSNINLKNLTFNS